MGHRGERITEQVNPRTRELDQLEPRAMLARILEEDARVPAAVAGALDALSVACDVLTGALRDGGRWFNLGAGTSGRIGWLDAAEIPPTFGLSPERVQGVIAGGVRAMTRAVEGAEDDERAARADLEELDLCERDAVVALSASGATQYVLSGVRYAGEVGAATIGVTCVPESPLATTVDVPVVVVVGPEAIAGSTRLKGGLAQKMVLHALSTSVMVRLGRVRGNLMTSLSPVNRKLRERAIAILCELTACSAEEARAGLELSDGSIEQALERLAR